MDEVRVSDSGYCMPSRARALPAFACIMAVIYCGMLNTSWWVVVVGACSLGLISLTGPLGAFAYHQRLGGDASPSVLLISSVFNASAAAAASFIFGRLVAWAWGLDPLLIR
jgi:hypothetical protein